MTHVCVTWLTLCVTWLITTHPKHNAYASQFVIWRTLPMHPSDMTLICVTWLTYVRNDSLLLTLGITLMNPSSWSGTYCQWNPNDMTLAWHDCHMWDVTHTCVTWFMTCHSQNNTNASEWHDSHMCDMTHVCVTWFVTTHPQNNPNAPKWHDSQMCDMTPEWHG